MRWTTPTPENLPNADIHLPSFRYLYVALPLRSPVMTPLGDYQVVSHHHCRSMRGRESKMEEWPVQKVWCSPSRCQPWNTLPCTSNPHDSLPHETRGVEQQRKEDRQSRHHLTKRGLAKRRNRKKRQKLYHCSSDELSGSETASGWSLSLSTCGNEP